MLITEDVIESDLVEIITEITGIPPEKIERHANFIDDLGIASIMAVDIVAAIEEKYDIEIPEERYVDMDCLDSVIKLLLEHLTQKGSEL